MAKRRARPSHRSSPVRSRRARKAKRRASLGRAVGTDDYSLPVPDSGQEIPRDTAPEAVHGPIAPLQKTVAAAAQRAVRVTYWPAQLCVLGAILLQVRLPEDRKSVV